VVLIVPAASLLKDVPLATLAAVLIYVATRLFHGRDLASIAKFDLFEFGLAVVTLLTVALVGVEQGIAVAVGLAIADRARLTARPQLHVLGRIPGTTSWTPLSTADGAAQVPGVMVVLFSTPLWYANSIHFKTDIEASLARVTGAATPALFVLDTIGMNDIDYTGCRVLGEVLDDFDRRHIDFAVARAGDHLRASLKKTGLESRIGVDHFFPNVDESVTALGPKGAA
jgi:MFS superfamily sulfate permease-like transporter